MHLIDPDGRMVDVVANIEATEPIEVPATRRSTSARSRVRIRQLQHVHRRVAGETVRSRSIEDTVARRARRLVLRHARPPRLRRPLPQHARGTGRSLHALRPW